MSRKRRRRTEESHDDGGRWLITYSDLITLLLVFFIVLYSMSSLENQRFNALVSSLKTSFQGDSILKDMGYPKVDQHQTTPSIPIVKKKSNTNENQNNQKLDQLYVKLNDYIKKNNLGQDMSLTNLPRGVQLTFREKILFDMGDADIKKGAEPILKKVGGILKMVPNDISVEGYTDNTPFRNSHSKYHSNWELSGARAQNVMFFLINHDHLPPARLHYVGYGQYKPVVKNDTAAHKAMNRRVNIVVMREQGQENQGN